MDNRTLFQNLVNLASVDGKFTDEEVAFLVSRAEVWGIPNDEMETTLVGIRELGPELNLPQSLAERRMLLEEMIRLIAADGDLALQEKQMLAAASARMGFSADEFRRILDSVIKRN